MTRILFVLSIIMIWISAQAQESLIGLTANPQLFGVKHVPNIIIKSGQAVKLPFVDDFGASTCFLNPDKWALSRVFSNYSYGVDPPSLGVATFDALNSYGEVYSHANSFGFVADSLISQDIRLDSLFGAIPTKLNPDDSVYFSFFYQPQGMGNAPEAGDSLVLEFFNPTTSTWNHAWSAAGSSLVDFMALNGSAFKQVVIPIVNLGYFKDNFKFRFYNYASIPDNSIPSWGSGLYDQWNIDYVYIDANRSITNPYINDIVVISQFQSLLKNYQSMPWNQYLQDAVSETDYTKFIEYKNLSSVVKNTNEYFRVLDLHDDSLYKSAAYPSANNINAGQEVLYQPGYSNFTFPSNTNKYADFEVAYRVSSNTPPADLLKSNDTLRFYQKFYNYYAYDDGVPEAGYGLATNGGRVAYRFQLNTPDSLQSIQMYFNQTLGSASQKFFVLSIWADNNGQPGSLIYEKTGKRPEYEDDLFEYHTYELDSAIYLSGTFYIGWRQLSSDNLNLGFDLNNDKHGEIFYNTAGSWSNSSYAGALMIRPILGDSKLAHVGIEPIEVKSSKIEFSVYPNPNDGNLMSIGANENIDFNIFRYSIFDISGKMLTSGELEPTINLNGLSTGIYIVRITNKNTAESINKKLVVR